MSIRSALVSISLLLAASASGAQDYPSRPIKIIVPFAVGGGADIIARLVGQKLGDSLGQPVVVENKAGAGGNIGAELVAKAPPDGHTLLMASSALVINPSLYAKVPYDAVKDFKPITQPALLPNILVVHPSVPARTVPELVAHAKARAGQLSYASAGAGTGTHLAGELFKLQTGVDMVHVPYKGGGAVINDLLSGQVGLTFATLPSVIQFVNDGRLRALAMTTHTRWPGLPDVPTLQQAGVRDFEISTWIGLLAPARTPDEIVNKLNREVVRIVQLPEIRERFAALGMVPVGDTPAQFAEHIRRELPKYEKLVKASGARID
jgi:tripartite-type tricarboxylate transporter receptor subunit TctC